MSIEGFSLCQQKPITTADEEAEEKVDYSEEGSGNSNCCENCHRLPEMVYGYEELLDIVGVLLKSKWVKESPVTENVLLTISKALADEIRTETETNVDKKVCDHETCQNFNIEHHKECQPCNEECKTVCLVESEVEEKPEDEF